LLILITPIGRAELGLIASPFAQLRLLAAHLVSAIPLAVVLTQTIRSKRPLSVRIVLGMALLGGVVAVMPKLATWLNDAAVGFYAKCVARSLIAVAMTSAVILVMPREQGVAMRRFGFAALLLAVVPVGLYAHQQEAQQASQYESFAASDRLKGALGALEILNDLGSSREFSAKKQPTLRAKLGRDVARLEKNVRGSLPSNASFADRFQRALILLSLDRPLEADAILARLPVEDVGVQLMRGAAQREAEQWSEAEAFFRRVLVAPDAQEASRISAYEGLGEALRKQGRYADAVVAYQEAAATIPSRAGYFTFQLGLLAADRQRPREALESFAQAVALDPTLESQVESPRRRVQATSFDCWR